MMLGLYGTFRLFGTLPDQGTMLDQRADVYAYFHLFASIEAKKPKG